MNEGNRRMELLGSAPIPKALLAMGLPAMIGMMINALYNLVDAYFVGGLGTSQMGAISVAFPLGQIVAGLGLLFGNGAASYISRLLGYGEKETANKAASTALYGSLLAGAVMIVCALLFLEPVLILLGATESILPYALAYAGIYTASSIFNVFNVTMNSIVTSEGAARTTMCALMAGAVLNIVLDPVFIYVLGLGVTGAATATAISQAVSALVYLRYVLRRESVFTFRVQDCCFTGKIISEIMKVGIPTLVFQLLTGLSITLINLQAKEYGDSVIAGLGAVTRITAMGSLMVFGFIKGFQPIAGFNYGAVFNSHYIRLYERRRGNDPRRPESPGGKRLYFPALWLLYRLFLPFSCAWQSKGRLYPGSVQTGNLLCASDLASAVIYRDGWDSFRPACFRRYLCRCCRYYGGPPAQRACPY